jgi:hypothetical protein
VPVDLLVFPATPTVERNHCSAFAGTACVRKCGNPGLQFTGESKGPPSWALLASAGSAPEPAPARWRARLVDLILAIFRATGDGTRNGFGEPRDRGGKDPPHRDLGSRQRPHAQHLSRRKCPGLKSSAAPTRPEPRYFRPTLGVAFLMSGRIHHDRSKPLWVN